VASPSAGADAHTGDESPARRCPQPGTTAQESIVEAGGSLMAVEKTLRLESTERFPLSHRHDDEA